MTNINLLFLVCFLVFLACAIIAIDPSTIDMQLSLLERLAVAFVGGIAGWLGFWMPINITKE